MKITKKTVEKLILTDLENLDPVIVMLDDMKPGIGSITICCFGKAWTAYWGAMGEQRIAEFFTSSNVSYLADRMTTVSSSDIDYEAISEKIGQCVDVTTALTYSDELVEAYGPDWHHDLPTCPNPDYQYLCRIIRAVQAGLTVDHDGHGS